MTKWFIMIIYITHGGAIDPTSYTVADLYSSEQSCTRVLKTIRISERQHGLCLPVATMNSDGVTVTQDDWIRDLPRQ